MKYDVATAIGIGQRDYQEDSVVADFNLGNPFGFVVVADGMGGHAAGDVASKIVATEVFSALKLQLDSVESPGKDEAAHQDGQSASIAAFERDIGEILRSVAQAANSCIDAHVAQDPELRGMGATLVTPIIFENRLYWLSIGDSPLFLYRQGALKQLNEDHSLAPQIDLMVKTGQIDPEVAKNHPDRNALTSVVMGGRIPLIDCRSEPMPLAKEDVLIAASDGLQTLSNQAIEVLLKKIHKKSSAEIAEALLNAVIAFADPDQDNVSIAVIKFR
jgi:protein phosphatase